MGERSHVHIHSPCDNSTSSSIPKSITGWNSKSSSVDLEPVIRTEKRAYNTRHLPWRLGADVVSAGCAAALVSPFITMIDRSIIENASGRNTLGASLRSSLVTFLTRPHRFLISKPFALIFSLYTCTYVTANTVDTVSSTLQSKPASTTSSSATKFVATSSTNLALCLYKDSHFARLFRSPNTISRAIPTPTYALFAMRDCLTIFASFNLPPFIAPQLSQLMGNGLQKQISSASAAQFLAPAGIQIISTPLHLLGLDLYNTERAKWSERANKVVREWGKSCLARMGRIVPAFGVGGVVNMNVRKRLMLGLE